MADVTVFLVSVSRKSSVKDFLDQLQHAKTKPLVTARAVEWIVVPSIAGHMIHNDWDIVVILPAGATIPDEAQKLAASIFPMGVQQAAPVPKDFAERNRKMLTEDLDYPTFNMDKPLMSLSVQRVELTPSLLALAKSDLCPKGPIALLNYISFIPHPTAQESYRTYIDFFKTGVGGKRGGKVKIIGRAVDSGEWDEIIFAQYPSLLHYVDMLCDPEYQEANYKYRLPILRDTCILMTTETELEWCVPGSEKVKPDMDGYKVDMTPSIS